MANNKVQLADGSVLIDLTSDTVSPDALVSGYTAHSKSGAAITGVLQIQYYYTGTTEPSASLGNDGDIYLKTGA